MGIGEQTLHIVLVAPLDAEHEPLGQVAQVVGGESISDSSVVCGHVELMFFFALIMLIHTGIFVCVIP